MRFSAVVLAAGFAASSVTAVGQPQAEAEPVVIAERLFARFDVDSDERLDRDEWCRTVYEIESERAMARAPAGMPAVLPVAEAFHPLADRFFDLIDTDDDDSVSRDELRSLFERAFAERERHSSH